jgi:hypothetical protein
MKKYLIRIILIIQILLTWTPAYGATWYAVAGTTPNFNAVSSGTTSSVWCSVDDDEDCSGGSWLDWNTGPATNDIFEASAITGIVINVDPKGTAGATKVHLKNTAGGNFSYALATAPATTSVDVTAGTADCVLITGTTAGKTFGITGSTYTGSAATANADAIYDTHATNGVTIVGNSVGANGCGYNYNGSGTTAYTGNCTGSDTSIDYPGCRAVSTGILTVVGNIINGVKAFGAAGTIRWNPTVPANGVTGNYFSYKNESGDAEYVGVNTDDTTKALSTFYYIDPTDGGSDQGTGSSGGGGAWAF